MTDNKQFPKTELQEKIYVFWSIRGYEDVSAILGNLNVSFHRKNPKHEQNGLSYQYLEQFWFKAQKERDEQWIELLKKNNINTEEFEKQLNI